MEPYVTGVSPIAIAALLAVTGFVLTLAFAPVGVLLALLTMGWGVVRLTMPAYHPGGFRFPAAEPDRGQPHG